ncbi:MAG: hypothetical protein R2883_00520 [Caldisericia bacterium]
MIRRIIIILILFSLIIPVGGANAACDINIYDIMVNPPIAQSEACISILFISSCDYEEGEYLTIGLPLGSELPYGCRNCRANIDGRGDRATYSGNTVTIQLNSMLHSGRHRFYICDVINPPSKGPHFVTITTRDGIFTSSPFDFSDTSIRAAEVEVDPDYVEACAEYEITFKTSATESSTCGCKKKTSITIQFPKGFILPQEIDPQFVLVNGRAVAYVGVSGTTITITPQSNLDANQTVRIKILSGAGIKNPKTPGWYKLKIHTSADRIPAESESFYIRPSTVTRAKVKIDDPFTCAKGSFTIDFKTGPYGEINKGQEIHIIFPPGFSIPEEIGEGSIAINNVPVTTAPKYGVDNIDSWKRIMIDSPVDVAAESDIQIVIFELAGIILPENPGSDYQLDIRTSSEFYRVPSWSFSVSNSTQNVTLEISPCVCESSIGYQGLLSSQVVILNPDMTQ